MCIPHLDMDRLATPGNQERVIWCDRNGRSGILKCPYIGDNRATTKVIATAVPGSFDIAHFVRFAVILRAAPDDMNIAVGILCDTRDDRFAAVVRNIPDRSYAGGTGHWYAGEADY